jgi:hypothetical protein
MPKKPLGVLRQAQDERTQIGENSVHAELVEAFFGLLSDLPIFKITPEHRQRRILWILIYPPIRHR